MTYQHEKRFNENTRHIITQSAINSSSPHNRLDINFLNFWDLLFSSSELKWEIGKLENFYQHSWPEQVLLLACRFYLINKIRFIPNIRYLGKSPIKPGTIALTLHFGLSPLAYFLNDKQLKYAVVSDYPKSVNISFGLIGLYSPTAKIISRDYKIFLKIIHALKCDYLISCTTDFRNDVSGQFNSISPSIFKFITRYQLLSQSIAYRVKDNGCIEIVSTELKAENAEHLMWSFIENQYSIRPHLNFKIDHFSLSTQNNKILKHFE